MPRHNGNSRPRTPSQRRRLSALRARGEAESSDLPPFYKEQRFLEVPSVLTGQVTWDRPDGPQGPPTSTTAPTADTPAVDIYTKPERPEA